jgi:hypothetical protein
MAYNIGTTGSNSPDDVDILLITGCWPRPHVSQAPRRNSQGARSFGRRISHRSSRSQTGEPIWPAATAPTVNNLLLTVLLFCLIQARFRLFEYFCDSHILLRTLVRVSGTISLHFSEASSAGKSAKRCRLNDHFTAVFSRRTFQSNYSPENRRSDSLR